MFKVVFYWAMGFCMECISYILMVKLLAIYYEYPIGFSTARHGLLYQNMWNQ